MKGSIWETLMETERAGGNNPGGENKRGVMDRKIVGGRATMRAKNRRVDETYRDMWTPG